MSAATAENAIQGRGRRPLRIAVVTACIGVWFLPMLWTDLSTFLNLTISGLSMGMLLFLVAAGLTIIFGLMDVLNFAHGAFFTWGAYIGFSVFYVLNQLGWIETGSIFQNLAGFGLAMVVAVVAGGLIGLIIERLVVRRAYGDHLKQILITMGATMVLEELISVIWFGDKNLEVPAAFKGSWYISEVNIIKFKAITILVGLAVFIVVFLVLRRTKLGIIVRAGVENSEIVQALGYNVSRIFAGVFAAGAALAAFGGLMWGIRNPEISPTMGGENLIFAFIVVIIGGLGSIEGSFLGALIVGLAYNHVAYKWPVLALGVNILIMALILLLRPRGLFGKE
ncbi:MAG: branched-chain amino acid ABC transporter permease [Proteobacteria bacterium]|nr:branched-chain amino acid ABC transporter permease [Pseudomonadota bacterium]MBU1739948.1 branched-chain amino acid ABC transporter permease [Pseudomonadota bacterium]